MTRKSSGSMSEPAGRECPKPSQPRAGKEQVPGDCFVGTSGWSYSSWKPEFYPQALSSKKFLAFYATRLNSVEVNYTFNRLPTEQMLANWLAATGPGFRFSFKAPQRITHRLRLRDCAEPLDEFCRALAPIVKAGKMGVVLFQLPPNFKADVPRLDAFLAPARSFGMRFAFEFRHSTWFCDEVYATLQRRGAALCVAESEDLETPDVITAPFACYRFRRSDYAEAELSERVNMLRRRAADGDVFAYFKHEEQPTGALRAVGVLRRIAS